MSFFQPLNFNCNPTENKAKGLTVAASLSKNGSAEEKSIKKCEKNGGKKCVVQVSVCDIGKL